MPTARGWRRCIVGHCSAVGWFTRSDADAAASSPAASAAADLELDIFCGRRRDGACGHYGHYLWKRGWPLIDRVPILPLLRLFEWSLGVPSATQGVREPEPDMQKEAPAHWYCHWYWNSTGAGTVYMVLYGVRYDVRRVEHVGILSQLT